MSSTHSPVGIPLQLIRSPTSAGETIENHENVRTEDVPSTAQRPGSSCSSNTEESGRATSKRSKKSRRRSTPLVSDQGITPLSDKRASGLSEVGNQNCSPPPAVSVIMPQDTTALLAESGVPSLGEISQPFVDAITGSVSGPREDDTSGQHDQDLGSTPPSETQSAQDNGDDGGPVAEDQGTNGEQEQIRLPGREDLIKALTKEFITDAYSEEERAKAWDKASETVMKYSNEMVEHWNKEIDGLLTFGGLFSAILTAFNVLSYPLLQPAPADLTNAVLAHMSAQLESFRLTPPFVNSTVTAFNPSQTPFKPPVYAIWLNTLWFTSLVFSLASATIGIIVKQWLKEYNTGLYGFSRDIARRRQDRYNNLQKWHVATIVAAIPVLLLIAAVLFLAGLLVLLHSVNPTVARIVSIFVGLLLVFITSTTVLPGFSRSCCYYSPQARALFPVGNTAVLLVENIPVVLVNILWFLSGLIALINESRRPFQRPFEFFDDLRDGKYDAWRAPRVWRGREVSTVPEATTLDASILVTAYSATLEVSVLDNSIVALSESMDPVFWHDYTSKLEEAATARSGSRDRWPEHVFYHFSRSIGNVILLLGGDTQVRRGKYVKIKDAVQKSIDKFSDFSLLSNTHQSTLSQKTRLWALNAMSGMHSRESEKGFPRWTRVKIRDPVTSKIVMVAAAHQLRSFVKNPRLSSPYPQRNIYWELGNVILPPLRIIEQLPVNYAVSGALAGIDPLVAARDALGSIHTFLLGMDWHNPLRIPFSEICLYPWILESIVQIYGNEHTRELITPTFVGALTNAFSCLIGEDDWEHTVSTNEYVKKCRDLLVNLRSTVKISSPS